MTAGRVDERAVERASATDRAFLAMDHGTVPEQFGVVLLLDGPDTLELQRLREVVGTRIAAVPRLRQRLVRAPLGGGGPVWVDDERFTLAAHVQQRACPAPGDEDALLQTALAVVMEPLPREAPLWSVTLVTGLAGGRTGVVIVLHHVLADGVGGLAVLGALVDQGAREVDVPFPRGRPSASRLRADAWRSRRDGLRSLPTGWRRLRTSFSAAGGAMPPRVASCALIRRTGPERRIAVVHADLDALRTAAHRCGATTNDAVLVAVAAALNRVLLAGGESLAEVVVTVPVSGRTPETSRDNPLGNMVSPMIVAVPTTGDVAQRLEQVSARVRAHKAQATGPPPIAVLGWAFRPLARLGGFRWYMSHQHRMHTLVSHVRGPDVRLTLDRRTIVSAAALGVGESGNTPVHFEVLSYAGELTVTVVADPAHFAGLTLLEESLRSELARVIRIGAPRAVGDG